MGGASRLKAAVLQVDCLLDWHSVLVQRPPEGELETHNLFERKYPGINDWYGQNFTRESLTNVMPLVSKLWNMATDGSDDLFLDSDLGKIVTGYEPEKRKQILAKFLLYAERDHRERLWQQQRMPFPAYWQPNELNVLVRALKGPGPLAALR
jgi:hypothetical protein